MSDTTPYPITITRDAIVEAGACPEGIAAFDTFVPDGALTIADGAAHVALLSTPLAKFEGWAVKEGLLPPIHAMAGVGGRATAGYGGTAMAGAFGVAAAGYGGRATAGYGGRATASYGGTATAGDRGHAVAGGWGTATAGHHGRATVGYGGTATAGARGRIQIDGHGGRRTAVGYIGETLDRDDAVLEAGVAYKVDDEGRFYRA